MDLLRRTAGWRGENEATISAVVVGAVLLLALLHPLPDAMAEPNQPLLEEIRFEKASPDEERIHFTVRNFSPPEVFAIEGDTPRVVCDFPGATPAAAVPISQTLDGDYIRAIRVGIHQDPAKTRVVLDLDPRYDYDVRKRYVVDQERFVLAITRSAAKSEPAEGEASPPPPPPPEP